MQAEEETARALSSLKRRRGVVRASLTRLGTRLARLEADPAAPGVGDGAKQLLAKLESLDKEFQSLHLGIIDLVEDPDAEDGALGVHEDEVAELALRVQRLVSCSSSTGSDGARRSSARKLSRLEKNLDSTRVALSAITEPDRNVPLLELYRETLVDLKRDLAAVDGDLVSLDLEDDDDLVLWHARLEKLHFDCSLRVKELLGRHSVGHGPASAPAADGKGVKLPKLDVPTFDGDILHWKQFWEQFAVSVHDRSNLSDAEKLVYLHQAIKSGSARNAIEGLSRSGDNYLEAVETLKTRYNRPRLTHRAHVRMIMDAAPLKDGGGKELRRLHDTIQQHLRALKAMKSEPDSSFVTSIIELKLDADTLFEWSKHSQDKTEEVPPYQDILEFIDLRAQASETSSSVGSRKHMKTEFPGKKSSGFVKPAASFTANTDSGVGKCVLCTSEHHPLYVCTKFKSLSHADKMSTLKGHNLCANCLGSGHYKRQCQSSHNCRKCHRRHHTLIHDESQDSAQPPPVQSNPPQATSNTAVRFQPNSLLMTCRVLVTSPDGLSIEARALLDNGSTVSFVAERLVQSLGLPRTRQRVSVAGIAGASPGKPIQSVASFQVSPVHRQGKKINLNAGVLPKVTCDLPVYPVSFDHSWNHLSDLQLADPAFGEPGRIDLLLGIDVFVNVLLDGRRTGPPGSPTALNTEFGWVVGGDADSDRPIHVSFHAAALHASTTCGDDVLRRFWEVEEPPKSPSTILSLEERAVVRHFDSKHSREDMKFPCPGSQKSSPWVSHALKLCVASSHWSVH